MLTRGQGSPSLSKLRSSVDHTAVCNGLTGLASPLTQGTTGTEELWMPRMLIPNYGGSDPQQASRREAVGFWHI